MKTVYLSCDVETTGPHVGINSCLSAGFVPIIWKDGELKVIEGQALSLNLYRAGVRDEHQGLRKGPDFDGETRVWWEEQDLKVWDASREKPLHTPMSAIMELTLYLDTLHTNHGDDEETKFVLVARPTSFDVPFLRRVFIGIGIWPFERHSVDLKSLAMALENPPEEKRHQVPHVAINDALSQAHYFVELAQKIGIRPPKDAPKVEEKKDEPDVAATQSGDRDLHEELREKLGELEANQAKAVEKAPLTPLDVKGRSQKK